MHHAAPRFILCIALALGACAPAPSGPRAVDVAAVRREIRGEMPQARTIISMGHVTADTAVVYTTDAAGTRFEETWIRSAGTWQRKDVQPAG